MSQANRQTHSAISPYSVNMLLPKFPFGLILLFLIQTVCGQDEYDEEIVGQTGNSKIFGGTEIILTNEAPWVASVEIYIGGKILESCGGAILSKSLILTSARCLQKGRVPDDIYVRTGSPDYNMALNRTVSNFTLHPKYKVANLDFDAAMLVLKDPLPEADVAQVLVVTKDVKRRDTYHGKVVTVYGWGMTNKANNDSAIRMLHKTQMTLLKNDKCNDIIKKATRTKIPNSKNCGETGGAKVGVCKYDYGGPVVYFNNGVPMLVGIISDVDECGTSLPNIFTSLGHTYDFVQRFLNPSKKKKDADAYYEYI